MSTCYRPGPEIGSGDIKMNKSPALHTRDSYNNSRKHEFSEVFHVQILKLNSPTLKLKQGLVKKNVIEKMTL